MDSYVTWLLRTNRPVFEIAGTWWCRYRQGLVPAQLKPAPLQLTREQERDLLQKSRSLFLRYFTTTFERPSSFWYTICSEYNPQRTKGELKRQLRRAYEKCVVRRIEPEWLASNGYDCYAAAFARYRGARPVSKRRFHASCVDSVGGPFEFWGVFVGDRLAGFAKCLVGSDYVASLVSKLHPDYLSLNSSSALRDTLLRTYVTEQRKVLGGGFRPLAHKTAMHDFLLKFGYRRIFCDLKVVYPPVVRALVNVMYPCKPVVNLFPPIEPVLSAQILLVQEEISRSFADRAALMEEAGRRDRSYV